MRFCRGVVQARPELPGTLPYRASGGLADAVISHLRMIKGEIAVQPIPAALLFNGAT